MKRMPPLQMKWSLDEELPSPLEQPPVPRHHLEH